MTIATKEIVGSIQDVINVTIRSIIETGKSLEDGVKGLVIKILGGLKSSGGETFSTILNLAGMVIKTTADIKADVVAATTGLIKGVIYSAKEMGVDAERAVSAAATGAINVAYDVSESIGDKVINAATGTIDGVKVIVRDPFTKIKIVGISK